jgi:hypothetical protein
MTFLLIEALAIRSMISKENQLETIGYELNGFQCFVAQKSLQWLVIK